MDNIEDKLIRNLHSEYSCNPVNEYSPLALAYIGDAVYEVYVRTKIISNGNMPVSKMHQEAKKYVKASEQARIYSTIENMLTEKEIAIFKRGRNSKPATIPKNALISDYKCATGFETLIGYLYIDNQLDRLFELLSNCIN